MTGPRSADTLFHAEARATYDAVVAMYHDQALIPLKTLAFDRGVNVTLGCRSCAPRRITVRPKPRRHRQGAARTASSRR